MDYWGDIKKTFRLYPTRAFLAMTLMSSQAFFYNAIFLTYGLTLEQYFGVHPEDIGYYLFPFAAGNFFGAVSIGRLFDIVGRRTMILLTYCVSGALMIVSAWLFYQEIINTAF